MVLNTDHSAWSKNFPLKKFSFPSSFAVSRNMTQPSGQTTTLLYLPSPPTVLQISAASDGFHEWKQNCHDLGTDPLSVRIDWAAIGTGVFVPNLLPIAAIALGFVPTKKTDHLDFKCVLLGIPFFSYAASQTVFSMRITEFLHSALRWDCQAAEKLCKSCPVQRVLEGSLRLSEASVQQCVNLAAYRTARVGILMKVKQLSLFHAVYSAVNIVKSDLLGWTLERRAAASARNVDDSSGLELKQDPPDDDGIDLHARGDEI